MAQALVVVLYDPDRLPTLLNAWHEVGVQGITVLHSAGGHSAKTWLDEVGLGALNELFSNDAARTRTVFSVFDDDELLAQAIVAADRIIGSFQEENTGLLFTLPVNYVEGLRRQKQSETAQPASAALDTAELITRQTPIRQLEATMYGNPVLVKPEQELIDVAEALAAEPGATIACVVNEHKQLIGLLPLRQLMDDLFMAVVPEEFLAESIDFDKVMNFAKLTQTRTAGDAMIPPVFVTEDDTVKTAFVRMHENKISGIPVVNRRQEVVGCISRIELLLLYAKNQKRTKGE